MSKIRVNSKRINRICQGDIFKDIEFIEGADEKEGIIEISKIIFPLVIVLSQDCDLEQDYRFREEPDNDKNQDKCLISIIVAPMYNSDHFFRGEHLKEIGLNRQIIKENKSPGKFIHNNLNPRFHYIEFSNMDFNFYNVVIDFKHYFTVNLNYLLSIKKYNYICRVNALYRERITQRFSHYLSRIGLP
jgi:hypothetical protein